MRWAEWSQAARARLQPLRLARLASQTTSCRRLRAVERERPGVPRAQPGTVRIMDPPAEYPNGHARFYNDAGQPI